MHRLRVLLLCLVAFAIAHASAQTDPDWTTPIPPFQIADHLYYVGSRDLAAYLITTPAGNILINANLESSPPQIRHSIEQLGFKYADTRILLNGQAHFDHMGGASRILRETHALNEVMDGDVSVVQTGGRTDFLASTSSLQTYPPAHVDRVLHDHSLITLGGITLTAHKTAGHTRGCTTYTLRVHLPGDPPTQLRNVVIVGGVSFWSDFHFIATPHHPASYPGIASDFAQTFRTLHALPCDIFLGSHGLYFNLTEKVTRYPAQGPRVFVDPAGYTDFVNQSQAMFEAALAAQQATSN